MPHLRLRVLPILLAALWQTNGEHFGVPQISAASSLRSASIQKSGSDGILARDRTALSQIRPGVSYVWNIILK